MTTRRAAFAGSRTPRPDRRPGQLEVWWHRRGPRGGDHPECMEVSGDMGARAIVQALRRKPEIYHAVRVMRWNGHVWKEES